jgi:hypothetical protein
MNKLEAAMLLFVHDGARLMRNTPNRKAQEASPLASGAEKREPDHAQDQYREAG